MKNANGSERKFLAAILAAFLAQGIAYTADAPGEPASAKQVTQGDGSSVKQPVFMLCPHKSGYSAWLLYVEVEKDNPAKLAALGLESLTHINSIDHKYDEVIDSQTNSKTERQQLGKLPSEKFSTGSLNVSENDALHVSLSPTGKDYQLNINMRVGAVEHFIIGGKELRKRSIVLHYDADTKTWLACATHLVDADGTVVVQSGYEPLYGVYFPVSFTGIYRIVGVFKTGEFTILMDR